MSSRLASVRKHITLANCLAITALFVALGGVAWAALPKNSVTSRSIKDNQIQSRDIKNGAVNGVDVRDGNLTGTDIADRTVTGADVKDDSLDGNDINESGMGYHRVARKYVTATDGADTAAARTAAPETTLLSAGQFTFTAKCFRSTATDTVYGEVYIKTSTNGAVFNSDGDNKNGGPATTDYLQTDTLETDRTIISGTAANNDANFSTELDGVFNAESVDGLSYRGSFRVGTRNGTIPTGTAHGDTEHSCFFSGHAWS